MAQQQQQWTPMYDWLASGETEQVWSLTLSIGRLHPLDAREIVRPEDKLIVIIPGNPGHCQFYETFATYLHQKEPNTTSVWVLSHVGHVRVPPELAARIGYTTNFRSNHLASQIRHKASFLLKYVPRNALASFNLIGHSIGAYIILEIFDALLQNGVAVEKAFFLFPTLERMAETPNGQFMLKLRKYGLHHLLDKALPAALFLLPDQAKMRLIDWRCRRHLSSMGDTTTADRRVMEAAADLFGSSVVSQAVEMGYDEMEKVRELNESAINKHVDRLFIVYALKDDWCPLSYRDGLIKKWPMVKNVLVENHGLEHAFVIFDSRHVADLVLQQM